MVGLTSRVPVTRFIELAPEGDSGFGNHPSAVGLPLFLVCRWTTLQGIRQISKKRWAQKPKIRGNKNPTYRGPISPHL